MGLPNAKKKGRRTKSKAGKRAGGSQTGKNKEKEKVRKRFRAFSGVFVFFFPEKGKTEGKRFRILRKCRSATDGMFVFSCFFMKVYAF